VYRITDAENTNSNERKCLQKQPGLLLKPLLDMANLVKPLYKQVSIISTVGLGDLKGLFQPKQFYDSIWMQMKAR